VSAPAPPLEIRAATPADAAVLTRLGARLFEQAFGADNSPEDMHAYLAVAFTEERQRQELEDPGSRVWVALAPDSEEPLGYAHVRRAPGPAPVRARRPAEVARFYVDRAWHGRGVANALMDACLAQADAWECDGVWLGVWQSNARAIAFYERRGFRKVGAQSFLLGRDRQMDWVMERTG
jgi:diamine N-acetyltransferase